MVVTALMGWAVLAGSYFVVLPLFGVLSPVTWALTWLGWLAAGVAPMAGAVRSRRRRPAVVGGACVVLAVTALATLGPPARTAEDLYRWHRADLDRLAASGIGDDRALPPRLRFLAVDGQAQLRCTTSGCGPFLLLWQDWRAESGGGLAYFPKPPDADVALATASGDIGVPTRELGHGWWLVE